MFLVFYVICCLFHFAAIQFRYMNEYACIHWILDEISLFLVHQTNWMGNAIHSIGLANDQFYNLLPAYACIDRNFPTNFLNNKIFDEDFKYSWTNTLFGIEQLIDVNIGFVYSWLHFNCVCVWMKKAKKKRCERSINKIVNTADR